MEPEGLARSPGKPPSGGGRRPRRLLGLDCPSFYLCSPKRAMKREDSRETYKLPHRLIEKKRRDRINECIAQLKDLLPEHMKLTTLGHLEKAVILELTLKHLKALTALTEQQHQKITALQNGEPSLKSPLQSDLDAFHSGFQTCTKEVLRYLSRFESWTPQEQRCGQLIGHLHTVCAQFFPSPQLPTSRVCRKKGTVCSASSASTGRREQASSTLESQLHCVPVIQRTHNGSSSDPHLSSGELGENDTDTDSGYGGEGEGRAEGQKSQSHVVVKQEPSGDEAAPGAKRLKLDHRSSNSSPPSGALSPEEALAALLRPDPALLSSLVAFGSTLGAGRGPFGQQAAPPFCLPFCLISPSAVAASMMQPFLDKRSLEKYLCSASALSIPLICPGIPAQAALGVAAAATLPCLSPVLAAAENAHSSSSSSSSSSTLPAPGAASPAQPLPHPFAGTFGAFSTDGDLPSQEQLLLPGKETP